MKTYQSFLTEKKGDTVVFTFGRFNPPTVGHEKLVTAVQSVARSKGGDFFVYPSHTQDSKKNPLNQTTKIKYLKKMFPKYKRNIIASTGKTALEIASELHDKKYTNLVMVVGSDRVQEFQKILDKYNGEDKAHGFYDYDKIEVVSAGERDPDAEGVEGMSASKMRAAAVEGDYKTFRMGTPESLSDADTKKMFNDIRKGMRLEVVKEGSKWKNIDFDYTSPIQKELTKENQINYENYTTTQLHTSFSAYDFFDELINSMIHSESRDKFYIKESLIATDKFLDIRQVALSENKIDQYNFHELEILGKKHLKLMKNLNIDHLDNSFIYKYISEIKETLEWGVPKDRKKYEKDTPGQEESINEGPSKTVKFLMDKLKITKLQADKIITKAAEKGIDVLKVQQRWSVLGPSLMSLVAEYNPQEKPNG